MLVIFVTTGKRLCLLDLVFLPLFVSFSFVSLNHPKVNPAESTTSQHGSISDKGEHGSGLRLRSSETKPTYSQRVIRELKQPLRLRQIKVT